jgi:hypothetical protein
MSAASELIKDLMIRADGIVPFETLSASVFEGAELASLLETHVLQSADCAVLECGCGSAVLSAILQRKGFEVTAVDAIAHDLWPLLPIEPRVLALNASDDATRSALDRWAAERSDRRRVMIAVHCCELAEQLIELARAAQCAQLVVVPCGAACGALALDNDAVTRIKSTSTSLLLLNL